MATIHQKDPRNVKIKVEWEDWGGTGGMAFDNVQQLAIFLRDNPLIGKQLGYKIKPMPLNEIYEFHYTRGRDLIPVFFNEILSKEWAELCSQVGKRVGTLTPNEDQYKKFIEEQKKKGNLSDPDAMFDVTIEKGRPFEGYFRVSLRMIYEGKQYYQNFREAFNDASWGREGHIRLLTFINDVRLGRIKHVSK